MRLSRCLTLTLLAGSAHAQLRPRRVGTNALGEQEVEFSDVPSRSADADADPLAAMQAAMKGMGGMEGLENMDMSALMKGMANNPMMEQLAKTLGEANPEVAQLLNNPEAMAEQMKQMQQMMASPEGQDTMQKMMGEMQSIMTDPEKLKAGIEQFASNPAFKGLADSIPGMREMLDDPEQLAEQAGKVSEAMQALGDPEKMQELLGGEGGEMMQNLQKMLSGDGEGLEAMQEAMQKMAGLMGGGGAGGLGGDENDLLAGLGGLGDDDEMGGGGDGDDLKARVREQMAQMMNKRRGAAAMEEEEF